MVDFDTMAVEWCKYVNARTIWPKLSAQLRSYYRRWEVNMCVREATRQAAEGKTALAAFKKRPPQLCGRGARRHRSSSPPPSSHRRRRAHRRQTLCPRSPAGLSWAYYADRSTQQVKKKNAPRQLHLCRDVLKLGHQMAMTCMGRWSSGKCEVKEVAEAVAGMGIQYKLEKNGGI